MFLLNLWGFYDFSVSLQKSFFAQLFSPLAHPPPILQQWNSLGFGLHQSGGFLFPSATPFGLHNSDFVWVKGVENACSVLRVG